MLKQLSIYAENRKSTLKNITGILEAEQINILGSVTNDSAEYGIVRMVVSEPDKAAQALEKEGYLCKLTDVTGVEVADEIGNLHHLLILIGTYATLLSSAVLTASGVTRHSSG